VLFGRLLCSLVSIDRPAIDFISSRRAQAVSQSEINSVVGSTAVGSKQWKLHGACRRTVERNAEIIEFETACVKFENYRKRVERETEKVECNDRKRETACEKELEGGI